MTDPTASRRTSALHPRAAAGAVAAVAVLLSSAVACSASNHVGSPSQADPGAAQAAPAQQFPAGMQTMAGAPGAPAGQQQAAAQPQPGRPPVALNAFGAATGCSLTPPDAGQQLKQTTCTDKQGARFAVTSFASRSDQQQWLQATLGGGSFLVGDRWAVGADGTTLQTLQQTVGGTITSA
ncbi:hypothetical protein LO771_16310 [Streptacidiphilus sp. ASG 303]|uniref:hypothetical protein n=1 Tax=Streptacidiphilus sp. ASG 303 TaxID=2896847 RepID=UPI001E571B13|nr:hypothetical protein [Streptacidiphilus sp. ASG 303]MCD0483915.1 hypothetical protein [Streptacidiphilus sp. ASG 303]